MSEPAKPGLSTKSRVVITSACIVLVLVIAAIYWFNRDEGDTSSPINFRHHYPRLASKIKQAQKVVLYEGLPHQYHQKESLADELKTKATIQVHGFPFYQEALPLSQEDAATLTTLFCDGKTLEPDYAYVAMGYRTSQDGFVIKHERLCGGYHPDYCVEWDVRGEKYQMQVCFGCGMVRCFGPNVELHCDIEYGDKSPFWKILMKYHKNRPGMAK